MGSRIEILRLYRQLHRTCQKVFQNDDQVLNGFRKRIKEEFWKNRQITEPKQLSKLIAEADEAERFLRQNVVQMVQTKDDVYKLNITKDTALADSAPLPSKTR